MLKLMFTSFFLYLCLRSGILKAEETTKIERINRNFCKNVYLNEFGCFKYGEKYYVFDFLANVTWYEALHNCRRYHGNLLTIETAAEMKALSEHLNAPLRTTRFYIWTAGNNLAKDTEFMSVGSGHKLNYTNWGRDQPVKFNNREHCIRLEVENEQMVMSNAYCKEESRYICELNTTIPSYDDYDF